MNNRNIKQVAWQIASLYKSALLSAICLIYEHIWK